VVLTKRWSEAASSVLSLPSSQSSRKASSSPSSMASARPDAGREAACATLRGYEAGGLKRLTTFRFPARV
jgi:hypothetical protein